MNVDWSFPKQIGIALLVITCLAGYPLWRFGSGEIIKAAVIAALMTTVNVLLGYAAVEYSFDKSMTTFFKYVLGGMGLRLLLMAVVLVLLIKVYEVHAGALVGSMGIFYTIFMTMEILFVQKKVSLKYHQ